MKRNPNGIGSYRIRADGRAEYRIMIDGRMRYVTAPDMRTLKVKVKSGKKRATGDTLDAWAAKWLESVKVLRSVASYRQYEQMYRLHIAPHIGSLRIDAIKRSDIQAVINGMVRDKLSSCTMLHARKCLHVMFNAAIRDELIPVNPVQQIEIPRTQAKVRKTLTLDEVDKLLAIMATSRWRHAVRFTLNTALRRSELLSLTWDDVDMPGRRMIVKGMDAGTKTRQAREIPLSVEAIAALHAQDNMLQAEGIRDWCELVFPSRWGKALLPNYFTVLFMEYAAKAGIHASPHMLRHTFVYLTRDVLTLKELQAILGHDKSTTTLDLYGDMIALSDETGDRIGEAMTRARDKRLRIARP